MSSTGNHDISEEAQLLLDASEHPSIRVISQDEQLSKACMTRKAEEGENRHKLIKWSELGECTEKIQWLYESNVEHQNLGKGTQFACRTPKNLVDKSIRDNEFILTAYR